MLKHENNNFDGERSIAAGDNARRRSDASKQALAGAETVVAFEDSSGNAIAGASPLSMDEREAGKNRTTRS